MIALFEGFNSFLKSFWSLDIRIIADASSTVAEELLIDTLQGAIFLASWFLDTILMVLVVLILGRVILIL